MATKRKKPSVIDNLVAAVAAMQVNLRKSTDQVENLILMMNARVAAAAPDVEPIDHEAVNRFDEEFLIGLWIADQRREGAKTIDLVQVETIREGMRYALELRSGAAAA